SNPIITTTKETIIDRKIFFQKVPVLSCLYLKNWTTAINPQINKTKMVCTSLYPSISTGAILELNILLITGIEVTAVKWMADATMMRAPTKIQNSRLWILSSCFLGKYFSFFLSANKGTI